MPKQVRKFLTINFLRANERPGCCPSVSQGSHHIKKIAWLLLPIFAACNLDEDTLRGRWGAAAFFEEGQSVAAPLDEVSLEFLPTGQYVFRGPFKYSEAGRFKCSMHYLLLTDTTVFPPHEKTLKVLFLSPDSLKIRMEKDGRQQVLFFGKQQ